MISTNQSAVSGRLWTNESAPLCLGEVGGPVGEVEDGKDERKKVSGDHINTLAAVYRELASGSEAATAATRFLVPVLMVLQPLEVAGVFQEGIL